ncbi:MAG TPA: hypothetical protein VIH71_16410 [Solirubrobacteraceae bacterium]
MAASLAVFVALLTFAAASGAASQAKHSSSTRNHRLFAIAASRSVPRPLAVAAAVSRNADRNLVTKAKRLKKCLAAHPTQPSACSAARSALQNAGSQLKRAQSKLASIAGGSASPAYRAGYSRSGWYSLLQAPKLAVSGEKLSWTQVAGVVNYVFVRKVPGQPDQYSTVSGTSVTPPPVPGVTVTYSVRTAVNGSSWASEESISYPEPAGTTPGEHETETEAPHGEPTPTETVDTQAAPKLVASGLKLSWNPVGDVSAYVLAIKVPGKAEQFTEVSGTSFTPPVVAGMTVGYSVRTAVDGSAWSPEVAISYPSMSTPPPPPPPPSEEPKAEETPSGSILTSSMWVGVDVGGWPSTFAADVAGAASYVRVNSQSSVPGYTAAGLHVIDLLLDENSAGVSGLNATEYAAKAVAAVKANPKMAALEVLNEPGNEWGAMGPNAGSATNAAAYDHLLKVLHEALVANFGNSYPPVLASYDGGEGPTTWGQEMWAAEPNVGNYINGITMHSYGGTSNRAHSALGDRGQIEAAHAQHPNIPIYVTEVGWPTAVGQPSTGDSFQWTEAEQAQNVTNFVNWAKGTGYIQDVTIFNYRDYGTNDFYGIETASGAHKLSYTALAAFRP